MKFSDHFKYWILPLLVLIPLIIMYFSGVQWATEIVCPSVNWELGIVENIQLFILLMILFVFISGVIKKSLIAEKIIYVLLALFTLFVFLEEIDYGAHFLEYFKGHDQTPFRKITGKPNIHNLGNNARIFKRSIYPLMLLIFIIAPFFKNKVKHPVLNYLIPAKGIIITAVITIFSYLIPRSIVEFGILEDGGFDANIGEFSEIMVYYIFFLYIHEIIIKKQLSIK